MKMKQQNTTVLWASAFIVAAIIFTTAGRHAQEANAASASTASGFTLLTICD